MNINKRQFLGATLGAALPASWAHEAPYPNRPVTIIVPFAAGNIIDGICRATAEAIQRRHKVNFVIDNVVGAGSMIGTLKAARSKPDGYTLLYGTSGGLVIIPQVNPNAKYAALDVLEPISTLASAPYLLVVGAKSPYRTAKDLYAAAKAKPDELTYGSNGIASSHHLTMANIASATQAKMRHVPFRTGPDTVLAIMRGDLDVGPASPAADVVENIKAGRLRALAVTSTRRVATLPEVPTIGEALGIGGLESSAWSALLAPKGTPAPIVTLLNRWANEALLDPALVLYSNRASYDVDGGTPKELAAKIKTEQAHWVKVIKDQSITYAE